MKRSEIFLIGAGLFLFAVVGRMRFTLTTGINVVGIYFKIVTNLFYAKKENYLLELVRYIHLNPVRAGFIKTVEALDKYPWTGHAVLIGKKKNEWQAKKEILAHFHTKQAKAVEFYREFIKDGVFQ